MDRRQSLSAFCVNYLLVKLEIFINSIPGHKYGPNHDEMGRKLSEMNRVIEHVTEVMPNDCVLFVMGDHGMTVTGDWNQSN
jgi:phosphopentomutase